jgi:hypothetical protein
MNKRLKLNRLAVTAEIRKAWAKTASGADFIEEISDRYTLERGDRAAIVLRRKDNGAAFSLKNILGRKMREALVLSRFTKAEYDALPKAKSSNRKVSTLVKRRIVKRVVSRSQLFKKEITVQELPSIDTSIGPIMATSECTQPKRQFAQSTPKVAQHSISSTASGQERPVSSEMERPSVQNIIAAYKPRIQAARKTDEGLAQFLQEECDALVARAMADAQTEQAGRENDQQKEKYQIENTKKKERPQGNAFTR